MHEISTRPTRYQVTSFRVSPIRPLLATESERFAKYLQAIVEFDAFGNCFERMCCTQTYESFLASTWWTAPKKVRYWRRHCSSLELSLHLHSHHDMSSFVRKVIAKREDDTGWDKNEIKESLQTKAFFRKLHYSPRIQKYVLEALISISTCTLLLPTNDRLRSLFLASITLPFFVCFFACIMTGSWYKWDKSTDGIRATNERSLKRKISYREKGTNSMKTNKARKKFSLTKA